MQKSDREIFKRSRPYQTDGNPLEGPLFSKWVNYVKQQHWGSAATKEILDILAGEFKSKNALISALVVGTETPNTKVAAEDLLKYQYEEWKKEKKTAADVFIILELRLPTSDLFNSPAFLAWVNFVRLMFSDDQEANKAMISFLRGTYENNLDRVLAEGATTQNEGIKSVVEILQKSLQEGSSESSKRQNDFDLNEPPLKRQKSLDLNEPSSKRQKSLDLNEALPESL